MKQINYIIYTYTWSEAFWIVDRDSMTSWCSESKASQSIEPWTTFDAFLVGVKNSPNLLIIEEGE